jgi:hypothetical protein
MGLDRKVIGYIVSSFGLGILTNAIIYPMGYMESVAVYCTMTFIGILLIALGVFIRSNVKKKKNEVE